MDWTIDFNEQIIKGNVVHTFKAVKDGVDKVVLDAREIQVEGVKVVGEDGMEKVGWRHHLVWFQRHETS